MEELKLKREKERLDKIEMAEIFKADQDKEAQDLKMELAKLRKKLHDQQQAKTQAQPQAGPAPKVIKLQIETLVCCVILII